VSTSLTFFPVSGNWNDVENPNPSGTSNQALFQIATGVVTFYPRVPAGFAAFITNLVNTGQNTAVSLAPIQARILSGELQTINIADTEGIQLLSNTSAVSSQLATIDTLWPSWLEQNSVTAGELIYDVAFTSVVYAEAAQFLTPFGFQAPVDATPVCLTDGNLTRLGYGGPALT
jgi:hypothetical protein